MPLRAVIGPWAQLGTVADWKGAAGAGSSHDCGAVAAAVGAETTVGAAIATCKPCNVTNVFSHLDCL